MNAGKTTGNQICLIKLRVEIILSEINTHITLNFGLKLPCILKLLCKNSGAGGEVWPRLLFQHQSHINFQPQFSLSETDGVPFCSVVCIWRWQDKSFFILYICIFFCCYFLFVFTGTCYCLNAQCVCVWKSGHVNKHRVCMCEIHRKCSNVGFIYTLKWENIIQTKEWCYVSSSFPSSARFVSFPDSQVGGVFYKVFLVEYFSVSYDVLQFCRAVGVWELLWQECLDWRWWTVCWINVGCNQSRLGFHWFLEVEKVANLFFKSIFTFLDLRVVKKKKISLLNYAIVIFKKTHDAW